MTFSIMKPLRILQYATVFEVAVIILVGLYIILGGKPGQIVVYGQFTGAISPFLIPQIAAAFAAKPLGQYVDQRVALMKAKKANGNEIGG